MLRSKSKEIDEKLAKTAESWYKRAADIDKSIQKEQEILLSDAAKTDSLVAVAFVAWDSDNDGAVDSYAYYDAVQEVSFEQGFANNFDKNFPNA